MKTLNASVVAKKEKNLKAFVIFLNDGSKTIEPQLTTLAETAKAQDIALTYLAKDDRAVSRYKVNLDPEVKNTVIVYKDKKVTAKFVNLKADKKGLEELQTAISAVTQ